MPHIPFMSKKANTSPFYGPNDEIPILVTILMGLQRKYKMILFILIHHSRSKSRL